MPIQNILQCDECKSAFVETTSQMSSLCPECSHQLYGKDNCDHEFKDGKCKICHWDGSRSTFIDNMLNQQNAV